MALTGSLTVVENLKIFHIEKRNGMSMTFMYFKPNYVQNSKWKNPIYWYIYVFEIPEFDFDSNYHFNVKYKGLIL